MVDNRNIIIREEPLDSILDAMPYNEYQIYAKEHPNEVRGYVQRTRHNKYAGQY